MKLDFIEIDESEMDIEDLQVERDLQMAAVDAIRRARRCGTYYVISEDDQIKEIPGDKTGPYEERLLARAARLDGRIAELQSRQAEEPAAVLNDRPAPHNTRP
ncbi:MAG TPA: hypothetical protein VMR33_04985 [Candidatus Baltobacteraceae bacterium]|jgi:hypothetical protein|nr:hypothetical protein [Candidatus Baltobacteraceae bacterium]